MPKKATYLFRKMYKCTAVADCGCICEGGVGKAMAIDEPVQNNVLYDIVTLLDEVMKREKSDLQWSQFATSNKM